MKSIVISLFVLTVSIQGFCQNYDFIPAKSIEITAEASGYSSNQIALNNLTTGSLQFKWKRLEDAFPAGWSYSLCDLGSCYPSAPDSATMNPTDPGGNAYFICHMTFNEVVDSGYLKLYVYEEGNEANGDTVTFNYITTAPTGIESPAVDVVEVYPNPASGVLNINMGNEDINFVKLYDMTGRLVLSKTETVGSGQSIDINWLPVGQYILHVEADNKHVYTQPITIFR
ncbi:MAG: T9SS type A sorting domain-containing protein [Flavobacteriales bacterium]|nr:T9SS type A sorting domain-containing protein [Flavobacteriales bacterium]